MMQFPVAGTTSGGPLSTCWKCNNAYPQGCVHQCPTALPQVRLVLTATGAFKAVPA